MPQRKTVEKVTAGSLVGFGAFHVLLYLWDWLTTGDNVLSIYEHLPSYVRFAAHPVTPAVVLIVGLAMLWWVTRDEPRPVLLYGPNYHEPLPGKKHPVFGSAFQAHCLA